ncbi:MAG TPA: CopG family transcriptional regulator [Gemmatimonadales bacterium]
MSAHRQVGEPVQVYLDADERQRLERLTRQLGATKSDVLRRGLEALERQAFDPATHPALQIIGLADRERAGGPGYDVAREHDRYLADSEEASWGRRKARRRPHRGR